MRTVAAPFCHRIDAKLERCHWGIKPKASQVRKSRVQPVLAKAAADFVDYYNIRRYRRALANVVPAYVPYGNRERMLHLRKETKAQTT